MLSPDPSDVSALTRRRVLVNGGRGLLALTLIGAAAPACGSDSPPVPDPLEAQLEAARRDSELADAAAKAAAPALVPALTVVSDQRARHAAALVEEIARAADTPTPTSTSSPTPTTSAQAAPAPSVQDVIGALRTSADSATRLAPTLSGYRAGLMGSIAASCATAVTVLFSSGSRPQ